MTNGEKRLQDVTRLDGDGSHAVPPRLTARVQGIDPWAERRRRVRRGARWLLPFVLLGAATTVAVCVGLAVGVDVSQGKQVSADAWVNGEHWNVTRWTATGAIYVGSVREKVRRSWGTEQLIGAPDTPSAGDQVTAWASASQDAQAEWLILHYAKPVVPREIKVYETYNPGALERVTTFTPGGTEVPVRTRNGPTAPAGGGGIVVNKVSVPGTIDFPVDRVKLYLDSTSVPGWNEIDAVGLVDAAGATTWASGAEASSVYGLGSAAGPSDLRPALLAPRWSGLRSAPTPLGAQAGAREERAVDARGWPMLAMWSRVRAVESPAFPEATTITPGGFVARGTAPPPPWGSTMVPAPTADGAPLPVFPIWDGFFVNTVFYTLCLVLAYGSLVVPRRFFREVGRLRRGCCIACGYDIGYDFPRGCPECGWRRNAERSTEPRGESVRESVEVR